MKPKRQQQPLDFTEWAERIGATDIGDDWFPGWFAVETRIGTLRFAAINDSDKLGGPWIACRFGDPMRAWNAAKRGELPAYPTVNRHSGKWNWHQDFDGFKSTVESLLVDRESPADEGHMTKAVELMRAAAALVREAQERSGLTGGEIARRLKTNPSTVSRARAGDQNMTLATLAEIVAACGFDVHVTLSVPRASVVRDDPMAAYCTATGDERREGGA